MTIATARRAATAEGVPSDAGFYAWWLATDALPTVPRAPHATEPLSLLYVGIAPSRATSRATLRSRILRQHARGNLAASTFRRSLAALLWREEGWTPLRTSRGKLVFSREENAALTAWQEENLRVSWCVQAEPWTFEGDVIRELEPPLNVGYNAAHPFYETIKAARAECLAAARPAS